MSSTAATPMATSRFSEQSKWAWSLIRAKPTAHRFQEMIHMIPLLMQKAHVQTFSHYNDDFQLTMYDRGLPLPKQVIQSDCIVVFTYSGDTEVSEISLDMARSGVRFVRINSDFPDTTCIDGINQKGQLVIGNENLTPKLLWIRHSFPQRTVENNYRPLFNYTFNQIKTIEFSMPYLASKIINGNVKDASLLAQLETAQTAGFDIPNGLITNDPSYAAKKITSISSKIVVKSLGTHWVQDSADRFIGIFPQIFSINELQHAPKEPVPVFYQEYIPHDIEIRAYVIGNTLISFALSGKKYASQLWISPSSIDIQFIELPQKIKDRIFRFQQLMHFDYGAIDLLRKTDGSYVFLEINLDGDWDYFEKQSNENTLIRKAMDEFLLKQFRHLAGN